MTHRHRAAQSVLLELIKMKLVKIHVNHARDRPLVFRGQIAWLHALVCNGSFKTFLFDWNVFDVSFYDKSI